MAQFQTQELGCDFPGQIVRGGPKPARYENDFSLFRGFGQGFPDCVPIRHRQLASDAQPEGKNFPGEKREMRILDVAEEKLGASVEDNHSHVEAFYQRTL